MADHVNALPLRGKTYLAGPGRTLTSTDSAHLEGTRKRFADKIPSTGENRSNGECLCILVRNVSGIALLPGRVVKYKSGKFGKQVDGYCAVTAEECAGVVDEFLPAAGVENNDLFWIVVKGPCLCKTDLAGADDNVIADRQVLVALTAATSQATTAGRVAPVALTASSTATTDGTLGNRIFNYLGRAMSAKTTANTNADVLVDLEILKSA